LSTLAQLRDGLRDRLTTIPSLVGVYTEDPGQADTPAAIVRMATPAITYGTSMGPGTHDYQFSILLLVSVAQGPPAVVQLDPYLDPAGTDSVYQALQADPELAGVADAAVLTQVANVGLVEYPSGSGVTYLGAELLVSVLA
jgi:hypothetical protein